MHYAREKVMHSSARVLYQSNYLPYSQLSYFFRVLMNACVPMCEKPMHRSRARA